MKSFRHLPTLRIISLRGNAIVQVDAYSFADLPLIESIDLTACQLVGVDGRGFAGCRHLADLSLAGNNLSRLSPATDEHLPAPSILRRFRVDSNPWLCDCRLRWLHERFQAAATVQFTAERHEPICNAPRLLRGIQWRLLSAQQFACPSRIITDGRHGSTHVVAATGTNVTVSCVVVGDPQPRVQWTRESPTSDILPLPSASRRHNSETTASQVERPLMSWRLVSSLHLVDIGEADAGEYRCTADNAAGRAEMTYTVVITSEAGVNRSSARDHQSHVSGADNTARLTMRIAVLICSATIAVVAVGLASCAVVVRLRTVSAYKVDDVNVRPTGSAKSMAVLRRSLTVNTDRRGWCSTSLVSDSSSTRQTASTGRQPVSLAWADCTLSPVDDQQQTTDIHQHQFRMTIFPAACCAYD